MKFYTVIELSKIFHLSEKTIKKMIKDKKIESSKVSKQYLISEDSLKRFIESKKV